ncbi:unnamed protein product [Boreogadus saida]
MCRSARRRGSAHQAHPGNHGHWDHLGEGDGRGLEDSRVGETRTEWEKTGVMETPTSQPDQTRRRPFLPHKRKNLC